MEIKLIKYWKVELFEHPKSSIMQISAEVRKPFFTGYAKDRINPEKLHGSEFISLAPTPDLLVLQSFRLYRVDEIKCTPVYESGPSRAEMVAYIQTAVGEGYQPEHQDAISDLSILWKLGESDLSREYGKCWQWYDMGGGLHETLEKKVSFDDVAKPMIKWLAENTHPHHLVIVTSTHAELLEGQQVISTHEYLKG